MKFANLLKDTTTATSTASMTLAGAPEAKYRSLAKVIALGKMTVGDTNICFKVEDNLGNWEEGFYTLTSATMLTRTSIIDSSNDGAPVAFGAGVKTVSNMISGEWLSKVMSTDDGLTLGALNAAGALSPGDVAMVSQDGGATVLRSTLGALKTFFANGTADTTPPSVPGSLATSGTTQTQTTLSWAASTDNSGVAPSYEVSRDGTTWTPVAAGTLNYAFTGLTAATLYTLQVRAVDGSGNRSTVASVQVTTAAASGDTTAPSMSGSVTATNVTQNSMTVNYPAGSDNVGVTRYEVSVDTGTANWINNGTNLSYAPTGLAASTTYTLRVRCFDAAGNVSNLLTGSQATSAAPAQSITVNTPAAQTTGTAFNVTGTYANGTPTALDYSLDGGTTWAQVGSATIGSGSFSFSLTIGTANASQTVKVRDRTTQVSGISGSFAVNAAVVFHFDGNYSTLQSSAAYGANSYASFANALYIKDASGNGINFANYDVYLVMHNSATVAPTNSDALHATHSNTFNLCSNPGNTPGLASGNSIFTFKDTMPAGTYYTWAVVVPKGAGQTGAVAWQKAFDGANTGTAVPFTVTN